MIMPTKRVGPALKWTPYIQESGRREGQRPPPASCGQPQRTITREEGPNLWSLQLEGLGEHARREKE